LGAVQPLQGLAVLHACLRCPAASAQPVLAASPLHWPALLRRQPPTQLLAGFSWLGGGGSSPAQSCQVDALRQAGVTGPAARQASGTAAVQAVQAAQLLPRVQALAAAALGAPLEANQSFMEVGLREGGEVSQLGE
jgi:hypothetical protein